MRGIETSEQVSVRRAILGEISFWVIALTVVGAVLTVIGAWDSVRDAGGDRYLGVIPLAVPAVIAVWAMLELCWRESDVPIQGRIVFGTLIAQIPAVLFSTVAWTVAGWLGSGVIERTAVGHYDHNYWPTDARGLKAGALMFFGSYGVVAALALAALLIVALPVQSFRRSREVFAGTDLSDDPAHVARRSR